MNANLNEFLNSVGVDKVIQENKADFKSRSKLFLRENKIKQINEEQELLKSFVTDKVEVKWLTGFEEVARILRESNNNSDCFKILKVSQLASDKVIKEHYKKLSVLIHPDKCNHSYAGEAFNILREAYNDANKLENKSISIELIETAKSAVMAKIIAENAKRKINHQELLSEDAKDYKTEILSEIDKIIEERKEKLIYAETTKQNNIIILQEMEDKKKFELIYQKKIIEAMRNTSHIRRQEWEKYKEKVKKFTKKTEK